MDNLRKLELHQAGGEAPRPLIRETSPATPFPVEALGPLLEGAARAINDKVQAPLALCGQSVIAVTTLAVQAHCDVQLPTGQIKPVSNNFMSIAASGERKSACDTEALWAIRKHEAQQRETFKEENLTYANEKAAWDAKRKELERTFKKDQEKLKKSLNEMGKPPAQPLDPMITCQEPTFEGLCRLLAVGPPAVGIFSAEGGQFIGGHGMSEDNKLRTATGLSSIWDGDAIRRVRAGDGIQMLPGKRCTSHLMAQPDIAMLMLSDSILLEQGLLSRFLITAPESMSGKRFWREAAPDSDKKIKIYGGRILSILEMPLPLARDSRNELLPRPLPLSPAARGLWISFADSIESRLGPTGELEPVRGLANKMPEHAARIAATINFFENLSIGEVDLESMERGIALADHYLAESLRLSGIAKVSYDLRLAQKLLSWLHNHWRESLISLPDIYQRGLNAIRDSATAMRIVAILESHGWLEKQNGIHTVSGERRREVWRIING
jgi:hypothetical protein